MKTGYPFVLCILSLLVAGCSNISEKRSELAAAGFRTIPATTPAQLDRLHSMKSTKVVPLNGKQGTLYVFADQERSSLMVGGPDQYRKYREIKIHQQKIDEQLLDAQVNAESAEWQTWGPYAGWGWSVASSPY